jgi:hypothetical protein
MQVGIARPENPQAYTAPVGVYLLVVAWTRRRTPLVYDALTAKGAAVLMVPSFMQSLGPEGFGWALLCGAEALGFVFMGLALGRRSPVAAGVVGLSLVVLRQTVDAVNALPGWAIMGMVGTVLLAVGTMTLAAREAVLGWLGATRARWAGLR